MKILIVDDDREILQYLTDLLEKHGSVDIAETGTEALEAFQLALSAGQPYDVLLLDIMMPGIDGVETLQEVRAIEADSGIVEPCHVMMITAVRDGDAKERSLQSSADVYVQKPISESRVLDVLRNWRLIA